MIGTDIQKLGKIDIVANDRVAVDHNAHTVSQIATVTDPGLEGDLDLVDRLADPVHRNRPPEQKSFVLGEAEPDHKIFKRVKESLENDPGF